MRTLHLAQGVLMAWRRCTPEAAFGEIIDAARDSALSPLAIASALVSEAAGTDPALDERALTTVRERWGELLEADR